ncbi:hypothetical protein AArcSl_0937 [Halalkaliarchaeum desulfuricum]|uniref:DUF7260 domain-containing protein n=1 Tax=Halalkaliarchaeum desulfuricum TaxID=2055893 RepID=A0A343THK3_9EURY|nr:hypothetical protein [Halalkaliarchaeum desulfuricum]AUX08575.1 hypothetical protein AArcSl_0937 [Halalkaliarchaeum desulfuricum]
MSTGGGQQWQLDRTALETGCTGWECGLVEALGEPAVALVAIAVGLAVFVSLTLLREAADAVVEERKHVVRERNAFEAFAERVERLQPEMSSDGGKGGTLSGAAAVRVVSDGATGNGEGIDAVEATYERTVMSMQHYEEEYGETLAENMAAELGSDVATAVAAGDQLTPGLQSALVSEARRAAKRRETLLAQLEDEAERIDEAYRAIEPVEHRLESVEADLDASGGFHEGVSAWNRLRSIETDLEGELERQQTRLDPSEHPAEEPHVFCRYLYGDDAGNGEYPVLGTLGRLLQRVERSKRLAVRTITEKSASG